MSTGKSRLVEFDVDAALAAARETAGEDLLVCVAYTGEEFEPLYVDEDVDQLYEDEQALEEHFGEIHSYVHLDFTERDLFEDLFIEPDGVDAFITCMGTLTAIRVMDDRHGLFLGVDPDGPIGDTVSAVKAAL